VVNIKDGRGPAAALAASSTGPSQLNSWCVRPTTHDEWFMKPCPASASASTMAAIIVLMSLCDCRAERAQDANGKSRSTPTMSDDIRPGERMSKRSVVEGARCEVGEVVSPAAALAAMRPSRRSCPSYAIRESGLRTFLPMHRSGFTGSQATA